MEKHVKEGDFYKCLTVDAKEFPLYYGYYEEKDRLSKYSDPIPIYPDFQKAPQYTDNGFAFVTAMQDACPFYQGKATEDSCFACRYYRHGEELIGVCLKEDNKRKNE